MSFIRLTEAAKILGYKPNNLYFWMRRHDFGEFVQHSDRGTAGRQQNHLWDRGFVLALHHAMSQEGVAVDSAIARAAELRPRFTEPGYLRERMEALETEMGEIKNSLVMLRASVDRVVVSQTGTVEFSYNDNDYKGLLKGA